MNPQRPIQPWLKAALGLAIGFSASGVGVAWAKPPEPAPPEVANPTASYSIDFEEYVLPNGFEVILSVDRSLPLVAVNLWYHVGPANEPKGRSGFAHLFEHLMFEGSKHVGSQFDVLMESIGATNVNGTTSWDRTNYYQTVPSEHLELMLWLESDRMGFMVDALTEERLEIQRGVVKNERRQSYENQPYGPTALKLYDTLFPESHPYHGMVIGSMQDLNRASMDDVRQFFRDFYAPNNATLSLVGDFDLAQAKAWIERYFGSLGGARSSTREPTLDPVAPRDGTVPATWRAAVSGARATPPLQKPVRLEVPEPVELAKVTLAWITPPAFSPDEPALDVLSTLLADGKATRLYRRLIVDERIASSVYAMIDPNQFATVFEIDVQVASGVDPNRVVDAVTQELENLVKGGPTRAEIERAKRRLELELARSLQLLNGPSGESGRAGILQRLNHYLGDPGALPKQVELLRGVSAADLQRVTSQYLNPNARALAITVPSAPASAERTGSGGSDRSSPAAFSPGRSSAAARGGR